MVHPFCWELSDAMEQNIYKYRPFSHSKKEPQVLFKHSPWHYSSLPLFKNWDVLPCKAGYSSFLRQIGDLEIQISCLNYKSKTRSSDIFQKDQVTSNKMRRYKKTRKDTPFHMVHPFCWVLVRKNIFWVVEFFYSLCDDAFSKLPLHRGLSFFIEWGVRKIQGFQAWNNFFSKNGFGGSLGSYWKVFHHGTLRNHFQGVVVGFARRPGGEKRAKIRWKIDETFLPLKYPICVQSWWKIDKREKSSSYMPKNSPEMVFKPLFPRENGPIFTIFCHYLRSNGLQ